MINFKYLYSLLLLFSISCRSQVNYNEKEKSFIKTFNSFVAYVNNNDVDSNSVQKYILLNYAFSGSRLDTSDRMQLKEGELSSSQLTAFKSQLKTFRNFVKENAGKISVIPSHIADDKYVYNAMTTFQKENSLVLIDESKKILGYILFMPPTKRVIAEPRIWSWKLTYQFGKYLFRSVTGEEGYEHIFTPK